MDVIAAFLYGFLEQQTLMDIPKGLDVTDDNLVCLLGRSIYGLKQSARMRYERFHFAGLNIGFVTTTADSKSTFALYVDDTILAN